LYKYVLSRRNGIYGTVVEEEKRKTMAGWTVEVEVLSVSGVCTYDIRSRDLRQESQPAQLIRELELIRINRKKPCAKLGWYGVDRS
jgi:hypothetical protein